jgi:hypothetical protein
MNYMKPDVAVLGNAYALIERNSQQVKLITNAETVSGDPDTSHTPPAYDLDE